MATAIEHYRGIINALGGVVPDDDDKLLTSYLQAIQDAIEAGGGGGGTPQVQSDWAETDTTKKSFIKNKPTLLTRVRLTADNTHIYKDGTALTYAEVEALVMNPNLFVTLVYNGEVSFLPSATDGNAIWFDGAFILSDVVNHMRVIIDDTDAVKVTQLELVTAVAGKGLSTNDYTTADKNEVAKVKDKVNTASLTDQSIKKIHLYDDFEIVSNGTDLPRLHWSDGEVVFGGDYVDIHSIAGEESRARFGDGIIKLEGSPYNAKNAIFEMGLDGNNKTYFDLKGDSLKFNNSDIATIDALQPVWISNLMTRDLDTSSSDENDWKLLSRQLIHILKNYNFMVLRMYIDDGNNTLIRNSAIYASSGDGEIILPITATGNSRTVDSYMMLGDEVHAIRLRITYDSGVNVFRITIKPSYTVSEEISWAYNPQYDSLINLNMTFSLVSFYKLGGFLPFTGEKTIAVS